MKELFIKDILELKIDSKLSISGWIKSIRRQKKRTFIMLVDSTGSIQVVYEGSRVALQNESSITVNGFLVKNKNTVEVFAETIQVIGQVELDAQYRPRKDLNIFASSFVSDMTTNRHLYIRNSKVIAVLKARALVITALRAWFLRKNYCDVTAPILTPILLYSEDTGIRVPVNNQEVFLTQCVGFYLESVVHSLEKVYNIGPSFRGKESSSKRHLTEYWHVKSELAFCAFDEFFGEVEDMLRFVTQFVEKEAKILCLELGTGFNDEALRGKFPRVK